MSRAGQRAAIRDVLNGQISGFNIDDKGILRSILLARGLNAMHVEILDHGYFYGDEAWNQFDVISPYARLYFITREQGWIESEHGRIDLLEGKMYLIPPYVRINLRTDSEIEKLYLHVNCFYAGMNIFEGLQDCLVLDFSSEELKELLYCYEGKKLASLLDFKGRIYQLLARFLEEALPDLHERLFLAERYREVHAYIRANLSFKLGYRDVARALKIGENSLRTNYRQDMGLSLARFIHEQVLREAILLLLNTKRQVKEIALHLGFDDECYFSRFFRKRMQYSPRQYRSLHGG